MKTCVVCSASFKPNRGTKTCSLVCRKTHARRRRLVWEKANAKSRAEYNRRHHIENRDAHLANFKAYYVATAETRRALRRSYYEQNRAQVIAAQVVHTERRRARLRGAPGRGVSVEDWLVVLNRCGYQCSYCRVDFDDDVPPEIEHVVPLSRGGAHDISNVVAACRSCNRSKSSALIEEWMPDWQAPDWLAAA